jgi:hypothetical protein
MKLENDTKINLNNLNINENNNCSICHIKNGEIICKECSPTNIFCQNCNESIHQLPSKQNHNKRFFLSNEKGENNKGISSGRIYNNRNNNSNLESTFSQTFRTYRYEPLSYCPSQDNILNSNKINTTGRTKKYFTLFNNLKNNENYLTYYNYNKEISNDDYNIICNDENNDENEKKDELGEINRRSPIVYNYIEQVRQVYEKEQNNMRLKQQQLQRELCRTKDDNERKINNLNMTINNMKSLNENNIQNLIKENEFELKQIINKKDTEINMLSNRNFELEQANNDLIEKLNFISNTMNNSTINNKEKISYYQNEINNITKNNNDLKDYYEKKIEYLTRIFAEEKNKLIAAYESEIDKINLGYMKSKKEYMNKAQNKDNVLRKIINDYSFDTNKLNNEINELNEEIIRLKNEEEELVKKNMEIKKKNDILRENYENAKRDIQYQIKQKKNIEKDFASTQSKFYKLKDENDKLNRLTYGTFKRTKSKGH